ncbi:MAG: hypothetical protein PUC50_12720 [Bacteroidales bacterium]|nr:hypothetical protein [Bacteroidales bacterium]
MLKFKYLIYCAVITAFFAACTVESEVKPDSSKEWDSISFRIFITDTNKYDLLDTTSKNYAGGQVTIIHGSKKYKIDFPKDTTKKFNYEPLKVEKAADSAKFCINFGKLNGAKNYDDDFIISWKLKKPVANQPATAEDIVHLRHIIFGDQSSTQWLFNGNPAEIDSTSASFQIKRIVK